MSAAAAKALKLGKAGGGRRPPTVPPDLEPEDKGEDAPPLAGASVEDLADAVIRIAKLEELVEALVKAEAKRIRDLQSLQPGKLMTFDAPTLVQLAFDEATLDKVCSDAMFAAMGSAGNRNPWNSDLNRIVQAALTQVKVKLLEKKKA